MKETCICFFQTVAGPAGIDIYSKTKLDFSKAIFIVFIQEEADLILTI